MNKLNNLEEREKNVTWGENKEFLLPSLEEEQETNYENNIFNKLKKINKSPENITLKINEAISQDKSIIERLSNIEDNIEIYKNKIDNILHILQNRENS